jgi:hypothetical protein
MCAGALPVKTQSVPKFSPGFGSSFPPLLISLVRPCHSTSIPWPQGAFQKAFQFPKSPFVPLALENLEETSGAEKCATVGLDSKIEICSPNGSSIRDHVPGENHVARVAAKMKV